MTLRNKDGSLYTLAKPNPVMKTQEIWEGYQVHNMQWDGETAKDTNQTAPVASDFDVKDTFLSALDKAKAEIKVSESKVETQPIERKPVVQPDLQREELRASTDNGIEKTFIYCLPAILRTKKDDLYGDSYTTVQYGIPISFEGVILNQQDLFIEIWTDADQINTGSVLFPKQGYKRWWRVQDKVEKKGGWVLSGTPSDHQPSFDL